MNAQDCLNALHLFMTNAIHAGWRGGIFIGILWLAFRICPKIPSTLRAKIWLFVCVEVLLCMLIFNPIHLPILPDKANTIASNSTLPLPSESNQDNTPVERNLVQEAMPTSSITQDNLHNQLPPHNRFLQDHWVNILTLGWSSVILAQLVLIQLHWYKAYRLCRSANQVENIHLLNEVNDLRKQLGIQGFVTVLETSAVSLPMVVGIFRSVVLLPEGFENSLTPIQRRMVLAHELAHIKNNDLLFGVLPKLLSIVLWYHPLFWLLYRCWRSACEETCDAEAIRVNHSSPTAYGHLLLQLVSNPTKPCHIHGYGVNSHFHSMRRRIKMLHKNQLMPRRKLLFSLLLFAIPSLALLLPFRLTTQESNAEVFRQPDITATPQKESLRPAKPSNGANPTLANVTMSKRFKEIFPNPQSEISLQEVLDRLGYTVNVPNTYEGDVVTNYNLYRQSEKDDSITAETFLGNGEASFQLISQQAYLCPYTVFGTRNAEDIRTVIQKPCVDTWVNWASHYDVEAERETIKGEVSLYITSGQHGKGLGDSFYSTDTIGSLVPKRNVMILPVRTGGTWVTTSEGTGYWEGGSVTNQFLICWEDAAIDNDYQDMIILVDGLSPKLQ